jgi:hypothetical protein
MLNIKVEMIIHENKCQNICPAYTTYLSMRLVKNILPESFRNIIP